MRAGRTKEEGGSGLEGIAETKSNGEIEFFTGDFDEHLKGVIQEEVMKISEEYPLLLSDKIRLNQEVFMLFEDWIFCKIC